MILAGGVIVHFGAKEHFRPPDRSGKAKLGSYRELFATAGFLTVVLVLFQVQFATVAPRPVFPFLVQQLAHATEKEASRVTGNLFCVVGLADMLSAWYLGQLADRWGQKRMLVLCTLLAGLFSLPFVLAQSIGQLYVLRFIFGLAVGGVMPSLFAIIRRITPEQDIGKAFGVIGFISCAAFFFGPLGGGYVAVLRGSPAFPITPRRSSCAEWF